MTDRLVTLYNWLEAMSAAGDKVKEKHENDYKTIIEYVKTSEDSKVRILAAQLIAKFFKYFLEYENEAFDSIVDLCESADVDVRKHATMALMDISRSYKQLVSKAADILIQLYQTNQASEVNLINKSLTTLLNLDIQEFLKSFFTNFEDGSEVVRERALKFLSTRIHQVSETALTKEVEEQLLSHTKKAMEDVTKDEFIAFIGILAKLKIAKTKDGQMIIVSIIKSQAELKKDFDPKNTEALDKFLLCTQQTMPFLSQYNRASDYINYICLKVLPHLNALTSNGNDLKILQALAEMSPHIIAEDSPGIIDLPSCQKAVYSKLLEYLPLPPGVEAARKVESSANNEAGNDVAMAGGDGTQASQQQQQAEQQQQNSSGFHFTHIEYLMYTLIQLCRLNPEFFDEPLRNQSRMQLQHLSNGCKMYSGALEKQLQGIRDDNLNKGENKLRSVALRTTKNISQMIIGLLKKPSNFNTTLTLSCKPVPVPVPAPAPVQSREIPSRKRFKKTY